MAKHQGELPIAPDLLTALQVAQRLSMSVRTLYRMVKQGRAPRPIRLSRKMNRWRRQDVDRYLRKLGDFIE